MTSNNKLLFLSVFPLLFLCACNPAPKYARPPAPTPTAYKEAPPDKEGTGWKLAQPGDDKLRGKWWEIYNDPQLNALEEQVAINNQSLKAAEANFRAARALWWFRLALRYIPPSALRLPILTRTRHPIFFTLRELAASTMSIRCRSIFPTRLISGIGSAITLTSKPTTHRLARPMSLPRS